MVVRKIIKIDEDKCNGCGQCVDVCVESALKIVHGKAKVIRDSFCDGLGACIGECPEGALTIEERDVPEFDEKAVKEHIKKTGHMKHHHAHEGVSCPSAAPKTLKRGDVRESTDRRDTPSELGHWPIQIKLVQENAPFLKGKDLMVIADCAAIAYPNLHGRFLKGKAVVMGCPKFDDNEFYLGRLKGIIQKSGIKSISVVNMEVPCCFGLHRLVLQALEETGNTIPYRQYVVAIAGELLE
jgi:NAD-dependent dihydropyrimidine dehydrogenase PreA subunit